jgi:NAD(P)H-flavin reductase
MSSLWFARTVEDLMMREEIAELSRRLDLQVTEVVQSPPTGWWGESGRVGSDLWTGCYPAVPGTTTITCVAHPP